MNAIANALARWSNWELLGLTLASHLVIGLVGFIVGYRQSKTRVRRSLNRIGSRMGEQL